MLEGSVKRRTLGGNPVFHHTHASCSQNISLKFSRQDSATYLSRAAYGLYFCEVEAALELLEEKI